jgi:hypothetical protein
MLIHVCAHSMYRSSYFLFSFHKHLSSNLERIEKVLEIQKLDTNIEGEALETEFMFRKK